MKTTKYLYIIFFIINTICLLACKKEWLDKKPRASQVVPTTIADAQALLDNTGAFPGIFPTIEMSSDDYEVLYTTWLAFPVNYLRNLYVWKEDIYEGAVQQDWNNNYNKIFISNVALETLEKLTPSTAEIPAYNNAKGSAHFFRAQAFLDLANIYCKPYSIDLASSDLGIALRLSSNVNETSRRSSVLQTYTQIKSDLKAALPLLPNSPTAKTRPSKAAVYGLLARVYLLTFDYVQAEKYADSCLQINNTLIDFNTLSLSNANPIVIENTESIHYSVLSNVAPITIANLIAAPELLQLYKVNDLRRDILFQSQSGKVTRKASYTGNVAAFGGIAVDEIYLIRAESRARLNRVSEAMTDLNTLLIKRYRTGTFVPIPATDPDIALEIILTERRKELPYRGLRWLDLRRLNQDSRFAVTLSRTLNGITYTLPPNDKRYTFAIPEIEIRSYGIEQNER